MTKQSENNNGNNVHIREMVEGMDGLIKAIRNNEWNVQISYDASNNYISLANKYKIEEGMLYIYDKEVYISLLDRTLKYKDGTIVDNPDDVYLCQVACRYARPYKSFGHKSPEKVSVENLKYDEEYEVLYDIKDGHIIIDL